MGQTWCSQNCSFDGVSNRELVWYCDKPWKIMNHWVSYSWTHKMMNIYAGAACRPFRCSGRARRSRANSLLQVPAEWCLDADLSVGHSRKQKHVALENQYLHVFNPIAMDAMFKICCSCIWDNFWGTCGSTFHTWSIGDDIYIYTHIWYVWFIWYKKTKRSKKARSSVVIVCWKHTGWLYLCGLDLGLGTNILPDVVQLALLSNAVNQCTRDKLLVNSGME